MSVSGRAIDFARPISKPEGNDAMNGLHRIMLGMARAVALVGGMVLFVLIIMTCIDILGRTANSFLHSLASAGIAVGPAQSLIDAGIGAIPGSYEVLEAGMAFCIFAFLPLCQVSAGHASVDLIANALPKAVNRVLAMLIAVLFAVVLVTIAVQLYGGMERKLSSNQTSLLLQFPVWWAYAASLFGAVLAAVTGVHVALVRIYELLTGRQIIPLVAGADH